MALNFLIFDVYTVLCYDTCSGLLYAVKHSFESVEFKLNLW